MLWIYRGPSTKEIPEFGFLVTYNTAEHNCMQSSRGNALPDPKHGQRRGRAKISQKASI